MFGSENKTTSGYAIGSLIAGILSIFLGWIPFFGWALVIFAIFCGFIALSQISSNKHLDGKGLAITGIVLGFVVLIFLLLFFLAFTSVVSNLKSNLPTSTPTYNSPNYNPPQNYVTPPQPAQSPPAVTNADIFTQFGKEVIVNDLGFTFLKQYNGTQVGTYIDTTLLGKKASGIYYIYEIQIENKGSHSITISPDQIVLTDAAGREFSADTLADIYIQPQGSGFVSESINPGIIYTGMIAYDVPVNTTLVGFKIYDDAFSKEFHYIKFY